jgi:zinc transport system ATP-binding protein
VPLNRGAVASVRGVSFAYGAEPILDDVSFELKPGEFAALVGPNGSGKSTLLRVLLGLLEPTEGEVRLFGEQPSRLRDRWRVGYVPQRPSLAPDLPATVAEVVSVGRLSRSGWWRWPTRLDREATDHALESVGLLDRRKRRLSELSGGQQQRSLIARAFASEPLLLVLDEPVAGVDAESQRLFRDSLTHLIEDHRSAVLLVSHELGAVAQDLDRVLVLKRSILFDGPPHVLASRGVSLGVHREDLPLWLEALT